MGCYIEYLDYKKNFTVTKKEFKNYELAYNWLIKNFQCANADCIRYYK